MDAFGVARFACSSDLSRIVFNAALPEQTLTPDEYVQALFLYNARTKTRKRLTPKGMIAFGPQWYGQEFVIFSGYEEDGKRRSEFRSYFLHLPSGRITVLLKNATGASLSR